MASRYLERHNVKNSGKNGKFVRKQARARKIKKGVAVAKRAALGGVVGGATGVLFGGAAQLGSQAGGTAGLAIGVQVLKQVAKKAVIPIGGSLAGLSVSGVNALTTATTVGATAGSALAVVGTAYALGKGAQAFHRRRMRKQGLIPK